jgi:pimeloyl-ACP methyl ester carboxylesterase
MNQFTKSCHTKTVHQAVEVDGRRIFYRRSGRKNCPALLLLHGFPSSSFGFRALMPLLSDAADLIAPDLPGFGFTEVATEYDYTFENISHTMDRFLETLGVTRYFVYLHDFGAAVGYLMAMRSPERILGLIVQNGNAHEEGLGPAWDAAKAYWTTPSQENRKRLGNWLNFKGTRDQYIGGIPERIKPLFAPETWHLGWERMSRPGNIDLQFRLFEDYQNHVARFALISTYHKSHQPSCLVMWGRHDVFFQVDEVLAYERELDDVQIHVLDGAHFLLETHAEECATLMREFIQRVIEAEDTTT